MVNKQCDCDAFMQISLNAVASYSDCAAIYFFRLMVTFLCSAAAFVRSFHQMTLLATKFRNPLL